MMVSRQNKRIKDIRRLRRSKGDHALLEGRHLVLEAMAAGLRLEEVLTTPAWLGSPEGREMAAIFARRRIAPLEVEPDVLDSLTDADAPRGVLAVAALPRHGVEALPVCAADPYLYIEGLQDPGNLGALARVAEAAGAAGIALSPGTVHPNHPRALRASAGSLLRIPVAVGVDPDALDRCFTTCRPRWVALVPRHGEDLYEARLDGVLILTVGAEGPGLSAELLERIREDDLRLTIPIEPPVESLNATVAAALVLFEIRRRRLAAAVGS